MAHRPVVPARRASLFVPGDSPMGLPLAARLAAVGGDDDRRRSAITCHEARSRRPPRHRSTADRRRTPRRCEPARAGPLTGSAGSTGSTGIHAGPTRADGSAGPGPMIGAPRAASRRARSSAPPCASSRGTACSTSSCRRSRRSRTIWISSRRLKRRRAASALRVLLEGYPPPHDPRLPHFSITPDPGVIEVNVQPAATLGSSSSSRRRRCTKRRTARRPDHREVHARRTAHRHRRRQSLRARRLHAGRQSVPAASGFAAQPGRATGTIIRRCRICSRDCFSARRARRRAWTKPGTTASTSWRSRSRQLPPPETPAPLPWLVDRALRHLLVDLTGNTHRAEFCIDKLYSPDSAAGRRGLLELRAFEMPPHARMSLAQQLLLRALIARFWREPYDAPLVRWGTAAARPLHAPVLRVARFRGRARGGASRRISASRPSGSPPHFEFRFPLAGELTTRAISPDAPAGARALARARRGDDRGRHGALRRFVASSGCRCSSPASPAIASSSPATAARCRCSRPAATASSSPACAIAPGIRHRACIRPFPSTRR